MDRRAAVVEDDVVDVRGRAADVVEVVVAPRQNLLRRVDLEERLKLGFQVGDSIRRKKLGIGGMEIEIEP